MASGGARVEFDNAKVKALVTGPEMDEVLQKVGQRIVSRARTLVRVDTGELRASIKAHVSNGVLTVGSDSDHALANELGTRRMRAQPFLRPALDAGSGS